MSQPNPQTINRPESPAISSSVTSQLLTEQQIELLKQLQQLQQLQQQLIPHQGPTDGEIERSLRDVAKSVEESCKEQTTKKNLDSFLFNGITVAVLVLTGAASVIAGVKPEGWPQWIVPVLSTSAGLLSKF